MPLKSRFRGLFSNKHGKTAQRLLKQHNANFTIFAGPFQDNSVGKNLC